MPGGASAEPRGCLAEPRHSLGKRPSDETKNFVATSAKKRLGFSNMGNLSPTTLRNFHSLARVLMGEHQRFSHNPLTTILQYFGFYEDRCCSPSALEPETKNFVVTSAKKRLGFRNMGNRSLTTLRNFRSLG